MEKNTSTYLMEIEKIRCSEVTFTHNKMQIAQVNIGPSSYVMGQDMKSECDRWPSRPIRSLRYVVTCTRIRTHCHTLTSCLAPSHGCEVWRSTTGQQSQQAVTAHFTREQLLPFGFADQKTGWGKQYVKYTMKRKYWCPCYDCNNIIY